MFGNKYASASTLEQLKGSRPRKRLLPQSPDFTNFQTYDPNLKRLANFGLEMMKFLPRFEQKMYSTNVAALPAGDSGVTFAHGRTSSTVSSQWWEAFNEEGFSSAEEARTAFRTSGIGLSEDVIRDIHDENGDTRYTNADTIIWAERHPELMSSGDPDGFARFRRQPTWIAGQHHRTGETGMIDGQGQGTAFRNLDFETEAAEWNHIRQKDSTNLDSLANFVGEQAYFINDPSGRVGNFLGAIGSNWQQVKDLLENNPNLRGKSFYQIVINRSYQSLSSRDATLLVAAMYESRERAWAMMTEIFGAVNQTRDDRSMMTNIDRFINSSNPAANHHALSLFTMFLPIIHSAINRMTTFYERQKGDGSELSILDRERFWEFSLWAGRESYNGVERPARRGFLYDYRQRYTRDGSISNLPAYNAVSRLIEGWFGATELRNNRPTWEGYSSNEEMQREGARIVYNFSSIRESDWANFAPENRISFINIHGSRETALAVFLPQRANHPNYFPSYGWDRKWGPDILAKIGSGVYDVRWVSPRDAGWADIMDQLWRQGSIASNINSAIEGVPHPNYVTAQFSQLSYNDMIAGERYNQNWAIYAQGMLLRWGQNLDFVQLMQRSSSRRVASVEYKSDMADHNQRKEEIEAEKAQEERAVVRGNNQNRSAQRQNPARQTASRQRDYRMGSNEYKQSLQKYSQRLLNFSKNSKALLAKNKKDTA
ncbi:hypothetical protein HZB07_01895 [Candidatus Saganbacteria bacterium]|nr:hypothetical protein [Candidatus Saganbacteria bacterium]